MIPQFSCGLVSKRPRQCSTVSNTACESEKRKCMRSVPSPLGAFEVEPGCVTGTNTKCWKVNAVPEGAQVGADIVNASDQDREVDNCQCLVCGPGGLLRKLDLRSTLVISQKSALSPGRVAGSLFFRSGRFTQLFLFGENISA